MKQQLNLHFPSFQHTLTIELTHATTQWSLVDYDPIEIAQYLSFVDIRLAVQLRTVEYYDHSLEQFPGITIKTGEAIWGKEQLRGSYKRNLWTPITKKDLPIIKKAIGNYNDKRL